MGARVDSFMGNGRMKLTGQGAVEYLLIVGVVLIIALMVISVLGFFPATAGESVASQSQLYWRGQASPFAVIDNLYQNSSVCNGSGVTGVVIAMKNTDKYTLTLTTVFFNNANYTVCGYGNSTGSVDFTPGQERIIGVSLPTNTTVCSGRSSDSVELDFRYNSPYLTGKIQSGSVNLHIPCS